jgi:hypothetical protein
MLVFAFALLVFTRASLLSIFGKPSYLFLALHAEPVLTVLVAVLLEPFRFLY